MKKPTPKPSTLKQRKRNKILNAVARRLLDDPRATFSSVGTAFTKSIFPGGVLVNNLTEKGLREIITSVLAKFAANIDSDDTTGNPKDMMEIEGSYKS